jgi:hypothetical protein
VRDPAEVAANKASKRALESLTNSPQHYQHMKDELRRYQVASDSYQEMYSRIGQDVDKDLAMIFGYLEEMQE